MQIMRNGQQQVRHEHNNGTDAAQDIQTYGPFLSGGRVHDFFGHIP